MAEIDETVEQNGSIPPEEDGQIISDEAMKSAMEGIELELDKAKKEVDTLKDSWLRERAEFQNYRRRTAHDLLNARKDSIKKFAEGFLNALENLERVTHVPNANPETKTVIDGVSMIHKDFLIVLEREGIRRLDPNGLPFDPTFMEAIVSEEGAEYIEETVIETYQKGYYYEDGDSKQPIRPARVKVGKPLS